MMDHNNCGSDPVTMKSLRDLTAALESGGVHTLEDLRLSIAKDPSRGLAMVATQTGASQALLVALLITEAKDDAGNKGKRKLLPYWSGLRTFRAVFALSKAEIRGLLKTKGVRAWRETRDPLAVFLRHLVARPVRLLSNWRRHWPDGLVTLLPVILVLLIVRANSINKHNLQYVTATTNVPAFHRISDQVENKSSPSAKGSFTNIAEVRDRYTLVTIPAGETLKSNQLLSPELSAKMQGRQILSVPIKTENYSVTLTVPIEGIMVLSPREWDLKAPPSTMFDVIVLRIEGSGEMRSAIVALQEDSFKVAASLLGSHDAFLSQALQ